MKTTLHSERNSIGMEIARVLFVVVLAALFFLLGHSMANHRFHQGGRRHWNGSVGQ
jgi:hypothetical protein